jgi:integrase
MKTAKSEWPKTVTVGNASVKVYRRITGSGNVGFMVAYRDTDGKRKFESCSVEEQAMKLAEKKAQTLSTFGARVAGTSGDQIAEFVRLGDVLKPFAVSVVAVVERAATWLQKLGTLDAIDRAIVVSGPVAGAIIPRTVAAAVGEMLTQKEANKVSKKYLQDIKYRLKNKFAVAFKCNVDTITAPMIQSWLDGRAMPAQTYMNFHRLINVFFEFCVARNYCSVNPMTVNGKAKVATRKIRGGEVVIYSPVEMQKLLAKAPDEFRPMLLISGFAGVRTEELKRLTWAGVDFAGKVIVLGLDVVKSHRTASRRVVPMSDNLRAWLEPFKDKKGLVWTDGDIHHAQEKCGVAAGVPWKKNGLRHSFCSYRLAITGDATKVAFEAGNSGAMVHSHYKALVTEAQAKEWFAIMPN